MTPGSVLPLYDAVLALLTAIPNMVGSDGEVDPGPVRDPDKRSHPRWIFYAGGGRPLAPALCGDSKDIDFKFTVVVAGGDVERCLWARDKVVAALVDVVPVVTGRVSGRIRLDYDVGPPRKYDRVNPPEFAMPLLFSLASTT